MNNMMDLGLEYVENTSDYDMLREQIYDHYGAAGVLGAQSPALKAAFDFPEPLWTASAQQDVRPVQSLDKEQFFKHMLHPDTKALLPFVNTVLSAEHKNSTIFAASRDLEIDRESIAQIVDRAYHLARAAGTMPNPQTKALLNALILSELLMWQSQG